MVAVSEYNSLKTYTAKEYEDKQLWNEIKGRFGKQYSNMDAFSAWQQMNSEELMSKVDQLLKSGREIGQGNGETRYQLAEGSYESLESDYREKNMLNHKANLRKLADESGIKYTKHDGGYTIDDALLELKEINSQKSGALREKEIKEAKKNEIIEIMEIIDEGYGGDWHYDWYYDNTPGKKGPSIIFWQGDTFNNVLSQTRDWHDNDNIIPFHQPRLPGYNHIPNYHLPNNPL